MTYKRFYKLFNRLPLHDDEMKERLVQQYTNGRTSSLRAMSTAEYDALCDALERSTADPQHELRKKKRSAALRLMQQLGHRHDGLAADQCLLPGPPDRRKGVRCADPAGAGRAGLETPRDPTQRRAESPAGTADRTGRAAPAADNLHAARRTS